MIAPIRRYFSFQRLYFEVWRNLPTNEQKTLFMEALANYGFDKSEPEFGDDAELVRAWQTVKADLIFSWGQQESGKHGGNMSGISRKTKAVKSVTKESKTKEACHSETEPISTDVLESFPDSGEMTERFSDMMKYNDLDLLVSVVSPLTPNQMRWLYDNIGSILTISICRYCQQLILDNGGNKYFEEPGNQYKTVGALIIAIYKQARDSFNQWLSETFPKVYAMEGRLSFSQYQELRYRYGRVNLMLKLSQLNAKKVIFKNATAFGVIGNWLQSSISKSHNSKFSLPAFDDCIENATIDQCFPGYDKEFDFPCYQPIKT